MSRIGRTLLLPLLLLGATAQAETVTVAVASNFAETAGILASDFEEATGHEVRIIQGSTGKLHAQIVNGAPFDIFLSADVERAASIPSADDGRFIYAIGNLVIWSGDPTLEDADCIAALTDPGTTRIAIANPALAPYGQAAKRFLESEGLWERVQPNLVYGENVAQALQFAATGNARIAIFAESLLRNRNFPPTACLVGISSPGNMQLAQQAVLLERAASNATARQFFQYLRSEPGRATIESRGYVLPERT